VKPGIAVAGVLLGQIEQRALELGQQREDVVDLVAQPEADVGRDLVVAERPVCRRLPASPTSAVRRFSMLRCTSSRSSDQSNCRLDFALRSAPCRARCRPGRRRDDALAWPASDAWASEPRMSCRHMRWSKEHRSGVTFDQIG
jgi:hypothetical protein